MIEDTVARVDITYTGDYSALDVSDLGMRFERGVAQKVPREWAARAVGLSPAQWYCTDPDVLAAAQAVAGEEADRLAAFIRETTPAPVSDEESSESL